MEKIPIIIISIIALIILIFLLSLLKQDISKNNYKISKVDQSTQTDNTTIKAKAQIEDISDKSDSTTSSKNKHDTSKTYPIPHPPPPPIPTKKKIPSYISKKTLKSDTKEFDSYPITPEILRNAKFRLRRSQDRKDKNNK